MVRKLGIKKAYSAMWHVLTEIRKYNTIYIKKKKQNTPEIASVLLSGDFLTFICSAIVVVFFFFIL